MPTSPAARTAKEAQMSNNYRRQSTAKPKKPVPWKNADAMTTLSNDAADIGKEQHLEALERIFREVFTKSLPQATYDVVPQDGGLLFNITVEESAEFGIYCRIPFVDLWLRDEWTHMGQMDDIFESYMEDLPEDIDGLLEIVARYYASRFDIKESESRFLKRKSLSFIDMETGETYHFRKLNK